MRVITGSARGMKLRTLEGNSVRPTSDRVKEAVFSIIQFEIEGRNVLDLFSGSGQLGIEALSRGAKKATFVDMNREAVEVTKENLQKTKLMPYSSVLLTDSVSFIKNYRGEEFDIVFLDPPYREHVLEKVLPLAAEHASSGGVIVCENEEGFDFPETVGNFSLDCLKKYSKTLIAIYRRKAEDDEA